MIWLLFPAILLVFAPLVLLDALSSRPVDTGLVALCAFGLVMAASAFRFSATRLVVGDDGLRIRGVWGTTEVGWDAYLGLEVHRRWRTAFRLVPWVIRKYAEPVRVYALLAGLTPGAQRGHVAQAGREIEEIRRRAG